MLQSHASLRVVWILSKKLTAILVNVDKLISERNQYSWGHKGGVVQANDGKPLRVDYYWSKIELIKDVMGHTKYPTILSVVKAVLRLDGIGMWSHY